MDELRIDAIQIRKAKSEVRVSFSRFSSKDGKHPNLTQKKRMAINELETAVELLKGKEVKYGGGTGFEYGGTGFEAGFFDLLVEWPSESGNERNSGGDAPRAKSRKT